MTEIATPATSIRPALKTAWPSYRHRTAKATTMSTCSLHTATRASTSSTSPHPSSQTASSAKAGRSGLVKSTRSVRFQSTSLTNLVSALPVCGKFRRLVASPVLFVPTIPLARINIYRDDHVSILPTRNSRPLPKPLNDFDRRLHLYSSGIYAESPH